MHLSDTVKKELAEIGYFLSRLGQSSPPPCLGTAVWKEAISKFYPSYGLGRTEKEFYNSLKNTRDRFDSHLKNSREGWKDENGNPGPLSALNQSVLSELDGMSDSQLWERIRPYAVTKLDIKLARRKTSDAVGQGTKHFSSEFSGSKSVKARKSGQAIVRHGSVVDALYEFVGLMHPEGDVYNTQKIDLALESGGCLKALYEVKTSTDTQSLYTGVGQLMMHAAGNPDVCKYLVLPEMDKNPDLENCLASLGVGLICYQQLEDKYTFVTVL
ncbi:hypothetical protein CS022_18140 [Veronia nyctiphanis]|uniref:Uncharacterized protein n=1 Tax=Veronia nyctiphanis TaxID=1278244 RepID=A0A4Q0YNM4_9GAMM|nr:hypothetical protein [Veronia nyctiphanis]RXJ72035.1 hypothetical protein CS022_18045 [Veronia nyctiphanis]RXJ72050.1 hypothetical protein CS022_18140 [Veronia nyctiphanis]